MYKICQDTGEICLHIVHLKAVLCNQRIATHIDYIDSGWKGHLKITFAGSELINTCSVRLLHTPIEFGIPITRPYSP